MRVTFWTINLGNVKPSGLVGTDYSPLPEALPQVRGIELLRSSWWTAFNKNNKNKIQCTPLFERHHIHRLKVIELPATLCVQGFAPHFQQRSLKDFTRLYLELRLVIYPEFWAEKSETLHTPLPRTASVVITAHHERKPGGLEYGVPFIGK